MRKSGFTLIELLVVIAIIAILAAILFPVFARAREKAKQASCLSNLKQFGIAMHMYSSDYDDFLVPHAAGTNLRWPERLFPYIKNKEIYRCPSADKKLCWNYLGVLFGGYGINYDLHHVSLGAPFELAKINYPSQTLTLFDIGVAYGSYAEGASFLYWNHWNRLSERHSGGLDMLFVDGHAKWGRRNQVESDIRNGNIRVRP